MLFACWKILCQLAPWLLLGMLFSGLLYVLLPPNFVRKRLQGVWGVVQAVMLGVPLPLCSCGVVPAGIGLKNQGASSGASVGFLISTPQTGIDSVLVSASFLGWPFAIFKMVVAAVTGLIGGWITDATERPVNDPLPLAENDGNTDAKRRRSWVDGWNHGIEIVRSIWIWLVVGVLLSAIIESWIPTDWIQSISGLGLFAAMLVMLVVSLPLYVCATASVPIAAALVISGLPPAAALVFLMAGPATNITTIGAIHARFGTKTTGIYLATIIIGSMAFAYVFDWLLTAQVAGHNHHDHSQIRWWETGSSGLLLLMLSVFAFDDARRFFRSKGFNPKEQTVSLNIEGMTCNGCVSKVEKTIQNCPGVTSVLVDLSSGTATIAGSPEFGDLIPELAKHGFQASLANE